MTRVRHLILTVFILSSCAVQALAYYHPEEGRWLSRDPLTELGNLRLRGKITEILMRRPAELEIFIRWNEGPLYLFVANDPIILFDALGLKITNKTKSPIIVKNEKTGQWQVIKPGETSRDSDGAMMNGTVIKHNTGVDITITEDDKGNISWDYDTEDDRSKDEWANVAKRLLNLCLEEKKKLSGTYNKKNFQKDHPDWGDDKIPPSVKQQYEKLINEQYKK